MSYFNDRLLLISDSTNSIDLFRLVDNQIIRYRFDNLTQNFIENTVTEDAFIEFNATIDEKDTIYLIHQDMSLDLILTLLNGENREVIKLTEKPIQEVYYLNLTIYRGEPHIIYFILTSKPDKEYRIYHHYFNGESWITNIVDDIKVRELLNPMKVFRTDKELIIAYYDMIEEEHIYIKTFNFYRREWKEKIKLTNNKENKLYVDFILKDNQLHMTYCQYEEGNLVVIYERLIYEDGVVKKEISRRLSNPENPQNPTVLYYEGKLWVSWVEYDNVMSCYSHDMGNSWSPIYLWNESKGKDIVRYGYHRAFPDETILNYSFGKINPDISFIGFGPTYDTTEIPLKKKAPLSFPNNLEEI